jgi:hypothetical protein
MMKTSVSLSLLAGAVTSLYFVPEVRYYSAGFPLHFFIGMSIQALHDAVCIFFFVLFVGSFRNDSVRSLLTLNCLHCVIMTLFCYYKRCILTLLYNHLMGIEICQRYIPLWQRGYNLFFESLATESSTCINEYRNTYLWLNNHILQSLLVFSSNAYRYVRMLPKQKS